MSGTVNFVRLHSRKPFVSARGANMMKLPSPGAFVLSTHDFKPMTSAADIPTETPPPEEIALADPVITRAVHVPFMQQPHVVNTVSLATSLILHVGLLLIGFVGYRAYTETQSPAVIEQLIIPDARMVENAPVGGVPNPGLGGDPERAAAQDQVKDVSASSDSWRQNRGEDLTRSLVGDEGADTAPDAIIAPGLRAGIGSGKATGSGGETGSLGSFGVPGGGAGQGPKANFFGISGNARSVAYVCDASGSMMNMMFALKAKLRQSIDPLRPIQAFNIIFFADKEKPQAMSANGQLIMAVPDNKRKAFDFLESVTTAGATNPIPGLEVAFKGKPQLVYLLTDGSFPDNNAVLSKIRDLNGDKKTKINTILFCDAANVEKPIEELLRKIAEENGGVFQIVDTKDY